MNDGTDPQLLRTYAENRSEAAFAELVRRHVDFVYSAALRMIRDSHLAEDVTQQVFVAVAKNAAELTNRPVLSAWLHRTAQNIAAQTVRTIERRRAREQEVAVMNELLSADPDVVWDHIAPHLDEALAELGDEDRDVLLLRYFERKSAREMAQTLGTSEDAAQKRVSRAVERLREFFAKRGHIVGASGLVAVISTNALQAAPLGLAATITTAALSGTAMTTTAVIAATKGIAMTTLQKTLITASIAAALGTGIYEARQASEMRNRVQILRQQQVPLTKQVQQLARERDNAARQLAALRDDNERLNRNNTELLRLRGKVGLLQREIATRQPQNASTNWKVGSPRRLEEMSDVGLATPEAALQTTIWASIKSPQRVADLVYLPTVNATNTEDVERKRRGQVDFAQKLNWSAVPEVTIERIDYHQQKRFDLLKDKNGNILTPRGEFADFVEITINYPGQAESVADQLDPHPPIPSQWRFTRVGDQWLQVILGASPDNLPKSAAAK